MPSCGLCMRQWGNHHAMKQTQLGLTFGAT